jgi:hypothetical protein
MYFIKFCFVAFLILAGGISARAGDFYDTHGNKVGSDGENDGKKYIVTKSSDIRKIKRITKAGRYSRESDLPSSVVLPSDAALRESLEILKRSEAIDGFKEQSSIVMKNDSVIRGTVGEKAHIVNDVHVAECILPPLPGGKTRDDVETTIHPHPTSITYQLEDLYPHSAIKPSNVDRATFAYFSTNIIVGPLEELRMMMPSRINGGKAKPMDRPIGIAVYYHNGEKPSVVITVKAAERILGN